ncbi:molecular chaperone TorD family protein [Schlegelella sp. S2-27]|uniref:Molecular chaperone TorD family protein n=1 Tax=Caldimonas mangrovi TaxID=2944811 RepID=A0ABT0YKD7_9BURK|nr:molecular chaperone TorD family protein [Caldimonas mangrovi]MCM5678869.1 molecular chaperone TorD family protein [Caldimonas mangrovi]
MSTRAQALAFTTPDDGEELARAELYGLLARLYVAAPDEPLLSQFRVAVTQAPQEGAFLEAPWQELVAAMRATDTRAAADEYDALFLGVGKPEVFLYGSYYLAGFLNEKPLAALRTELTRLGLGRDEGAGETEDHVAYVFEVMRYLIAGDDIEVCNLEQQRRFFRAHVQPWLGSLCEALAGHPRARLYRAVAGFTQKFVEVEAQGFDLLE